MAATWMITVARLKRAIEGREARALAALYGEDAVVQIVTVRAYFEALKLLRHFYISSYTEPKAIPIDPRTTPPPNEHAIVMVREGHGAIGLKHAWTAEQLRDWQELVPRYRPRSARRDRAATEMVTPPDRSTACEHTSVPDRHGGMRWCASPEPMAG
jgi:hypothetical protein